MRRIANRYLLSLAAAAMAAAGALRGAPLPQDNASGALLLPRPPFSYFYSGGTPGGRTSLRLIQLSERRNRITDEEDWFQRNGLSLPTFGTELPRGNRGRIPKGVPDFFAGQRLIQAIEGRGRIFLIYGPNFSGGRYLLALDPAAKRQVYALDFRNYIQPPSFLPGEQEFVDETVQWAEETDGLVYVSTFHSSYAKNSRGKNGYLTALDPKTGRLRWRSRPLVCNTHNFVLLGDAVVTGYGFTAEPDYLYVLDRKTGAVSQTVKVRSGPEYLIPKDGKLYVRTYDTDYVFRLRR
jgi:outer membrane protein assembly factor BamB